MNESREELVLTSGWTPTAADLTPDDPALLDPVLLDPALLDGPEPGPVVCSPADQRGPRLMIAM